MPFKRSVHLGRGWQWLYRRVAPFADFEGRAFRLRFWPFFLAQTLVAPLPLLLFFVYGPNGLRGVLLGMLLLKIGFGGMISAFFVSRFFPVLVAPDFVRARNLMGLAHAVAWHEIEWVRPIQWLLFTRFLLLKTPRGLIWWPRFLHGQEEAEALLREYAPPETALGRYLEAEKAQQAKMKAAKK